MIILDKKTIMLLHGMLIQQSGGSNGVRDDGLLESAIMAPLQTFGGEELYPTIIKKAACLCYSLVNDHCFIDGNKRIGILGMMTFLELNKFLIECSDPELVQLGLGIADGKIQQEDICRWLTGHIDE